MRTPLNAAAEQIVRAQSIVSDLAAQASEIQAAITRQQDLIDQLMPLADWGDPDPLPDE